MTTDVFVSSGVDSIKYHLGGSTTGGRTTSKHTHIGWKQVIKKITIFLIHLKFLSKYNLLTPNAHCLNIQHIM